MKKILTAVKPYLPLLSLIPIGLLIVASVWRVEHWISFPIGLLGMALILVSLFGMESKIKNAIEEEDPYFYDDPVFEEKWEKRLIIISPVFMIIAFLGLGLMRFYTVNLIKEGLFTILCGTFSILVASAITSFILKKYPFLKPKTDTQSKVISCLWVGFGISTALVIISLNFFLPPITKTQKTVAILENGAKHQEPEAYIWVDYYGEKMKLRPNHHDFKQLTNQDATMLTISTGALGFDYVSKMSPK